jgi:hypothetical protein
MQSKAAAVPEYLASLPEDRRNTLESLRKVFAANMDPLFEEGMQYGMIGYYLPHRVYPAGYHCDPKQPLPFAGLASQKNHLSLYLMCLYSEGTDLKWFSEEWAKSGHKLDMGRCCVRFRRIEEVPLDVVAALLRRVTAKAYVEHYEANIRSTSSKASAEAKAKPARKKAAPAKTSSASKASMPGKPSAKPAKARLSKSTRS